MALKAEFVRPGYVFNRMEFSGGLGNLGTLLPFSVLGVLLIFAGSQLALTVIDMKERRDLFVSMIMLGITLASNLAVAFGVGILLAYAVKSKKLNI